MDSAALEVAGQCGLRESLSAVFGRFRVIAEAQARSESVADVAV